MPTTPSKILIVDDDRCSRDILAACLAGEDYQIEVASNGCSALELTTHNPPDLILLDVMMPEMNGYDMCRHLRLDPLLSSIPVVMVTGLDDEQSRLEGFRAGADAFVTKPVNRIELQARVRSITRQNRFRNLSRVRLERSKDRIALEHACESILEAHARALEKRGVESPGHLDRLTDLSLRLAHSLSFSPEDITRLRRGVLLHDSGLNLLPPDSPRNRQEAHPSETAVMFAQIPFLQDAMEIPGCHHEKWDGTGYPRGLKGQEIPLAARLFAVVDAWDSLLSGPAHRKPLAPGLALKHLRALAGTSLDPVMVNAFLGLLAQAPGHHTPLPTLLAVPPPADKPPRERNVWRDLSLVSRGSRVHFFTGLTLTSVIPPLALCFTLINEGTFRGLFHGPFVPVTVFVLLLMGLGSSMLAKYPANLLRLRRNLETLGRDGPMDLGNPTHGEDDLEAIERNMNRIVTLFQDRIRTIQHQSEALLDAERQRVAIEGLGAACHHMGQPASTMIMALYLTRKAKTPEERESALQLCQQSMDEIREILHKLLHLATYRTEPYLDARPDSTNRNILKI